MAHVSSSILNARYVLRDDHPFCIRCYENVFANNCDDCGKVIGIDSKVSLTIVLFRVKDDEFLTGSVLQREALA